MTNKIKTWKMFVLDWVLFIINLKIRISSSISKLLEATKYRRNVHKSHTLKANVLSENKNIKKSVLKSNYC